MALSDYRPISPIGSMYKFLAIVLAARLKKIIPVVVDKVQSAFIRGRNIQDGILIANEVVEEWKRSSQRGVIIKLDFEKAFDKVNWNYLLKMMDLMNFPQRWKDWIEECLSCARVSVLVNGSPCEEFQMQKGIRQGDPMSPFLFIIAAEGLNWLLKNAELLGSFSGLKIGIDALVVTHLQFADDTLIFF
ncbi:secreted RxLR effector protein 78-like [Actinidia eriantha]|uniref:secreted RxLR effector protein 78-like n=1 Tax=Actinidia eriantha TaxID=165200 RepID=UPI00258EC1D8|nr:secreted RxLR effector protein 78-like [Actinidia eriantha]